MSPYCPDSPDEFKELSNDEQNLLIEWIPQNFIPRKTPKTRYTSYGLKHLFEHDREHGGHYLKNGQFKGAMLASEFKPLDEYILKKVLANTVKIYQESISKS